LLLSTVTLFTSCNLFDDPEPIGNAKVLWKTELPKGLSTEYENFSNVQFNRGILLERIEDTNGNLYFITENGSPLWKWSDLLPEDYLYYTQSYQNNGLLFFSAHKAFYCVDLNTGLTQWNKSIPLDNSITSIHITGSGNSVYANQVIYNTPDSVWTWKTIKYNIGDGQSQEAVTQSFKGQRDYLQIEALPIQNDEGLLFCYGERLKINKFKISHNFSLYNLTKKKWEYEKKIVTTPTSGNASILLSANQKKAFLLADSTVHCINVFTVESFWTKKLTSSVSSVNGSAGGKIIFTTYDEFTHCLDQDSGSQLWEQKTADAGKLKELNGVIYFLGRKYQHFPLSRIIVNLFAIDLSSGNILWRFEAPDKDFQGEVRVVSGANGGRGKIITPTGQNVLCYEAIR
jgi:outer membrane protein assembly factor BamB